MQDQTLEREYKGYTIRLTPQDEACSSFSMTMESPDGEQTRTVPAAGKTEDIALERAREMIDTELALAD